MTTADEAVTSAWSALSKSYSGVHRSDVECRPIPGGFRCWVRPAVGEQTLGSLHVLVREDDGALGYCSSGLLDSLAAQAIEEM